MKYVESIRQALTELLQTDSRVYLLGEDILDPYGGAFGAVKGLSTQFPDRIITTPISEGGIVGIGTGMAMRGLRPIVEIMFGDFLTLAADQLINSASKFSWMYNRQVSVPLLVRVPMGGYRGYGPTHSQTLESIFLNIPGLRIYAPSNYHNPGKLLTDIMGHIDNPTIWVENKSLYPVELEKAIIDESGTALVQLVNGKSDITIIAYGGMADIAVQAAKELLLRDEIVVSVISPSCIKPLPKLVCLTDKVLILEETSPFWGWGAEVGYVLEKNHIKTRRLGALPTPIPASREEEKHTLPQVEDVIREVRFLFND